MFYILEIYFFYRNDIARRIWLSQGNFDISFGYRTKIIVSENPIRHARYVFHIGTHGILEYLQLGRNCLFRVEGTLLVAVSIVLLT